ncbi:hypothetical protein Trydic_g6933 [Trypoxylus dichotomus]
MLGDRWDPWSNVAGGVIAAWVCISFLYCVDLSLYQERDGPNRQDARAIQYKNDIQTHAAITPPAAFGEGPQGSSTGVYGIPCSCGLVYIGTTKRSINTRLKEHKRNCRLAQTDKSAVAEHALQDGEYNINFANTEVLSTVSHFYTRLQREAIEIYKHPGNFNRKEENLAINKVWYPVLRNAQVTCTANRTDRRRTYNGCTPNNESFDAEPPKRTVRPCR